jgi:hypothetical protein
VTHTNTITKKPWKEAPKQDHDKAKAYLNERIKVIEAQRAASKLKAKSAPKQATKEEAKLGKKDSDTLANIAKVKGGKETGSKETYADAHKVAPITTTKTAPAGPKPGMNKQDAGQKAPAPAKKKVKLSERLKGVAKFAEKLGDNVIKANNTTAQYNEYKQRQDPNFKGERLTVRNTFVKGRNQ